MEQYNKIIEYLESSDSELNRLGIELLRESDFYKEYKDRVVLVMENSIQNMGGVLPLKEHITNIESGSYCDYYLFNPIIIAIKIKSDLKDN